MEKIFWTGYSKEERHVAINMVKSVVSLYGDIVDFKLFSDLSITMVIEIEELKVDGLYNDLLKITGMEYFECLHSTSRRERRIYLNITFTRGTGNLLIEVPSVPG
ncbi:hypothetical protein GCM10027291_30220 [Telluribacter humicola]